ncbi:MAG: AbrB/MazE/SpoVT family DNA-binding domain-containing protein [Ruminococcaceae bacterium]|nr:AbrB/MazE/SpoVT family DNA-binding domain-containing protein [Oscillospiraceae bacterium]
MKTARVFMSGGSQAVRLPKEYRFDCDELIVSKVGEVITLTPKKRALDLFKEGIEGFTDDFVAAVEEVHSTFIPSEREEL